MYWQVVGPSRFGANNLLNFGRRYIYKSESSPDHQILCKKHIEKLTMNIVITIIPIVIFGVVVFSGTMYAYYYQHVYITPFATNLPLLEKDTDKEFIINMLLQTAVGLVALIGCSGLFAAICMINDTIVSAPDFIALNLSKFYSEFSANGICIDSIGSLRNAFLEIHDYYEYDQSNFHFDLHKTNEMLFNRYMLELIDVSYAVFLIAPTVLSFSVSLSIFAQIVVSRK